MKYQFMTIINGVGICSRTKRINELAEIDVFSIDTDLNMTCIRNLNADNRVQAKGFKGDSIISAFHQTVTRVFYWPLWHQELVHFAVVATRIQVLIRQFFKHRSHLTLTACILP